MGKKGKYFDLTGVRRLAEEMLKYRDNEKISREDLAGKIGISPRCLANIECCDTRCSIETLRKIVKCIPIDVYYVLSNN